MGRSNIAWTDYTFNPWIGCTKVSPGCDHCYAERENKRFQWNKAGWGTGVPRHRTSPANWRLPLKWNAEFWWQCSDPECDWRGPQKEAAINNFGEPRCPSCDCGNPMQPTRSKVFCASLADVFDPEAPDEWRSDLWNLIEQTPKLDWLLLTKRPENIESMLPERWSYYGQFVANQRSIPERYVFNNPPLPRNIWFGITAENQDMLDRRWPSLEAFAHAWYPEMLFLSIEPMLGLMPDLWTYLDEHDIGDDDAPYWTRPFDWVIVGGESGPEARTMSADWVRSARDRCQEYNTPFFFKQWGDAWDENGAALDGRVWKEFP